jgi:hypothetical protein
MATEARTVEVRPEDYSYVVNPYREPIERVSPGDRVTIHTNDAFESRIQSESDVGERGARHGQVPEPPRRTDERSARFRAVASALRWLPL